MVVQASRITRDANPGDVIVVDEKFEMAVAKRHVGWLYRPHLRTDIAPVDRPSQRLNRPFETDFK